MSNLFLLENTGIVFDGASSNTGSDVQANTSAGTVADADNGAITTSTNVGGIGTIGMIIYIVGLVVVFYLFVIRPQKKREKELKNLQDAVKVGDNVVTSMGFYGKVTDVYTDTYVIEFGLNKGVRIPVSKSEVIGIKEPNLSNKSE